VPSSFVAGQQVVVRVAETDIPAFRLRKGEGGVSVFVPDAVDPPLSETEILDCFRAGSHLEIRTVDQIEASGCQVEAIVGDEELPLRMRLAHAEICPAGDMNRREFKRMLRELE